MILYISVSSFIYFLIGCPPKFSLHCHACQDEMSLLFRHFLPWTKQVFNLTSLFLGSNYLLFLNLRFLFPSVLLFLLTSSLPSSPLPFLPLLPFLLSFFPSLPPSVLPSSLPFPLFLLPSFPSFFLPLPSFLPLSFLPSFFFLSSFLSFYSCKMRLIILSQNVISSK